MTLDIQFHWYYNSEAEAFGRMQMSRKGNYNYNLIIDLTRQGHVVMAYNLDSYTVRTGAYL